MDFFLDTSPKRSKSYLVVEEQNLNKAVDVFIESKVKAISEEKQHLMEIGNW